MLKKIISCLIVAVFNLSLLSNSLPNREMIILLETIDAENINLTLNSTSQYKIEDGLKPSGLGAISITMLIALYQQACPIIANKSLLKNIIDHQNLFNDFLNLDKLTLHKKYGRYNRFKGHRTIDNFQAYYQYLTKTFNEVNRKLSQLIKNSEKNHLEKVIDQIMTDKRFNLEFYPSNLIKLKDSDSFSTQMIYLEAILYTLCSLINFEDWQIKQVNEDVFLLIPKNYIEKLNLKIPKVTQRPSKEFTALELELGLKVDHMKNIDRSFFEYYPSISKRYIYFTKSLKQIFITKKDSIKGAIKHVWSIYMTGHGQPKCLNIDMVPQFNKLKNLLIKKLKAIFKEYKDITKNKIIANQSPSNYNQLCRKYIKNIKHINTEIKNAKEILSSNNKELLGVIASLSIDEFRDVLKFLNDNVEISLLYYTSCFGGGIYLIEPYIENGKPLILNFTVISGTPAENMSVQQCPFINLPPYTKEKKAKTFRECFDLRIKDIDVINKKLELVTTLKFNDFFSALRKGYHQNSKDLLLLPYTLHPHVNSQGKIITRFIPNFPLIRFANSDHFEPISNDKSSIILDTKNENEPILINKNACLIFSKHISGKITLSTVDKKQNCLPQFISMVPGFALHVFEEVNSSTLNLKEIINSFLTFPELSASKIFWIKKLECLSSNGLNKKNESFKDIIILRNVFNSNILNNWSDQEPLTLENCAYFSGQANKESKLTWDGPFIEENNYKINPWNNNDHKEECLNSFPQLAKFINPVLQSA